MIMLFREFYEDKGTFRIGHIEVDVEQIPLASHERVMLEDADDDLRATIAQSLKSLASAVTKLYEPTPPEQGPPTDPDGYGPPLIDVIPGPSLMDTEHMKKFRVSLRYPKTTKGFRFGHYMPNVIYVFANTREKARDKVIGYVRSKLDPTENADFPRRVPKRNFLKDVKIKDMNVKVKEVKTWKDLLASLPELAAQKWQNVWDSFSEADLQLILKQAKNKTFDDDLKGLDAKSLKVLKKAYFMLVQSPDLTPETQKMIDPDVDAKIKGAAPREKEPWETWADDMPTRPTDHGSQIPGWDYWSVHEPKTDAEEKKLLDRLYTPKDVFLAGLRYGIPPKDIRGVVAEEMSREEEEVKKRRAMYDDLVSMMKQQMRKHKENNALYWKYNPDKRPKVRSLKDMLKDGSPGSREMEAAGINWGKVMERAVEGEYADVSSAIAAAAYDRRDPDDTRPEQEAQEFVWDLLSRDRPQLQPRVSYYKRALELLLQDRANMRNRTDRPEDKPKPGDNSPMDDPIPF